jgi:mRNA interferase RelE/StbE
MTYELAFKQSALKEWKKLDATARNQFKARLVERLENPRVDSARLAGLPDCYKIKLAGLGYRMVYQVSDARVTVTVIAVGKREKGAVYRKAHDRL